MKTLKLLRKEKSTENTREVCKSEVNSHYSFFFPYRPTVMK